MTTFSIQLTVFSFVFGQTLNALCTLSDLPSPLSRFINDEQGFESYDVPDWLPKTNLMRWESPYAPAEQPTFMLKGCWIPLRESQVSLDTPLVSAQLVGTTEEIKKRFTRTNNNGEKEVLFFTHPEESTQKEYLKGEYNPAKLSCEEYCATPTSSNRTVLVWKPHPEQEFSPVFIKLSMGPESGIKNKHVTSEEALRSVTINNALTQRQKESPLFFNSFNFFKEPLAIDYISNFFESTFLSGAGLIVREIPSQLLNGSKFIVPALALYGHPTAKNKTKLPYLLQAFKNKNSDELHNTISEKIIRPFVAQWLDAVLRWGFTTESHGQNLLVELDDTLRPNGIFWHRDLDGFTMLDSHSTVVNLPVTQVSLRVTSTIIYVSIYLKFNIFLYQLETSVKKWQAEHLLTRGQQNEKLESVLYRELITQLADIVYKEFGLTLAKNHLNDYESAGSREEISTLFFQYSRVVGEIAKLFSLEKHVIASLLSSLKNQNNDIDITLLREFGFEGPRAQN